MECCGEWSNWMNNLSAQWNKDGYFIDQHAINIMNNGECERSIL